MPHLYVVCGHGDGDPGAGGCGYDEAERVRALGARIKELGGDNVTLLDTSRNFYYDTKRGGGYYSLNIPSDACLVELHMDSAEGARGAHVIVKGDPDAYDQALADFISGMFPGRANKLVSRNDLQNPNVCYRMGINYRLVENGFITSQGDVDIFNSRIDDIARGYLRVFGIEPGSAAKASAATQRYYSGEEDDMTPGDVWGYAWYNDKGENTAPGGNMYNCAVYNYWMTEELLKRVIALEAANGTDPEAVAEAVKKAVEEKLNGLKLNVTTAE